MRTDGKPVKKSHEKCGFFHVTDGHLIISRSKGAPPDVVAAYRPDRWLDAVVEDNDS